MAIAMAIRDILSPLRFSLLVGSLIVALYFIILCATSLRVQKEKSKQWDCQEPARYPLKDPLFGIDFMYEAIRAVKSKTFLKHKRGHYERYGNTFTNKLSTFSVINTIEPDNIRQVLSAAFHDYEVGFPRRNAFWTVLGDCIFTNDGRNWEHSRALLRPCFARSQTSDLSRLDVHIDNLINMIPSDGSTIDLSPLFLRYTADVTTDFMFGESMQSLLRPESIGSMSAFRRAQQGAERRFRLGVFAKFYPQPEFNRAVKQIHAYVDDHIDNAIKHYKTEPRSPGKSGEDGKRYVFLHELLKTTGDGQTLRNELLAIFFAGRDTTSALLSNMFFIFARNPRVWNQVRDEVEQLKGAKPNLDELKGMKYLNACMNETLRFYPVVPGTSRIALRDTVLPKGGGADQESPVFVPAGTLVSFHFSAIHLRRDLWGSDVDDFRPERWQHEKADWKFLPFGGGPRNCIGQQFALTETLYTVVRLAQRFSDVASRDPEPWTESVGASCCSANGVKVALSPC